MSSPHQLADGADDPLAQRLRLAGALGRCPVAALYRIDGDRAFLVAAHVPSRLRGLLAEEVPSWRVAREQLTVVPVIGRGPAAPESAALPGSSAWPRSSTRRCAPARCRPR
ncbi:MAG: hypothetical protein M5U28_16260 [Sandaracinaceae bacterium]|nr:hypothetical protein [Sandaracinaceae bacterium]